MQRADALSRQAADQRAAGDLPEAIALQSQSVTVRTTALGADSPDVAAAQTNLAGLYAAADRYDEAEPLLRRALAIREKAYGADGRLTALSRNNLALLLAADGRSAEAELLYLQAIAVLEHDDPKEFATVLENYAALLDDTGRHDEAKAMEQRAAVVRVSHQEVTLCARMPGRMRDESAGHRSRRRQKTKGKSQKSPPHLLPFDFCLLPFAFFSREQRLSRARPISRLYFPFHSGFRFSAKAITPSIMSPEPKSAPTAG